MTDHTEFRLSLGSFVVGALDPATRAALETHLRDCEACRGELNSLSALPGLLARLTPEQVSGNYRTGPEEMMGALLARARVVATSERRRLQRWRTSAGVLTLAAAALLGVVAVPALTSPGPSGPTYQLHATQASSHVSGQVMLITKPWGTELVLSLKGMPAGAKCVARVSGAHGIVETIGNWGPTPTHAAELQLATDMTPGNLANVTIATVTGQSLLRTNLLV